MQKSPFSLRSPLSDIQGTYAGFDAPITSLDCGQLCAVHNPTHKPFCCDICQAVPAAYQEEWVDLQTKTNLWHAWRGDECPAGEDEKEALQAETPESMLLLACLGPQSCQREFRLLSCRQFPFFAYVTSDYRFLGLAYDWEFEDSCWVISHLELVSESYRAQFIQTHDRLFAFSQEAFESYQVHSERMREIYSNKGRRILLLHRNGNPYLLSPRSERLEKISPAKFPKFGFYREKEINKPTG